MLSKILTGQAGAAVARLTWPAADGVPPREGAAPGPNADGEDARNRRRIAELEHQMERRVRDAHAAGYAEGEAAGRAQAAAALEPVLGQLARSIQQIAGLRPQVLRDAAADLIHLSLGIARRILHRELSVEPAAVEGLVAAALARLPSQDISRIRTHPDLEAGVRQALAHAGQSGLPLVADGALERGAILLETARGKLDASLETQLAEIGRGLADRLPEG